MRSMVQDYVYQKALDQLIEDTKTPEFALPPPEDLGVEFDDEDMKRQAVDFYSTEFYEPLTDSFLNAAISDGARLSGRIFAADGKITQEEFDLIYQGLVLVYNHCLVIREVPGISDDLIETIISVKVFINDILSGWDIEQSRVQIALSTSELHWFLKFLFYIYSEASHPTEKYTLIYTARELIAGYLNNQAIEYEPATEDMPDLRGDPGLMTLAERAGIAASVWQQLACKPVDYVEVAADKPTLLVFLDSHTNVLQQYAITHDVALIDPTALFGMESIGIQDNVNSDLGQEIRNVYDRSLKSHAEWLEAEISFMRTETEWIPEMLAALGLTDVINEQDYLATVEKYIANPTADNLNSILGFNKKVRLAVQTIKISEIPAKMRQEMAAEGISSEEQLLAVIEENLAYSEEQLRQFGGISTMSGENTDFDPTMEMAKLQARLKEIPVTKTETMTAEILKSQDIVAQAASDLSDLHPYGIDLFFIIYPKFSNLKLVGHEDMRWRDISDEEFPFPIQIRSFVSFGNMVEQMRLENRDTAMMQIGRGHYNSVRAAALKQNEVNVIFFSAEPMEDWEKLNAALSVE